jgi:hypothetical protein
LYPLGQEVLLQSFNAVIFDGNAALPIREPLEFRIYLYEPALKEFFVDLALLALQEIYFFDDFLLKACDLEGLLFSIYLILIWGLLLSLRGLLVLFSICLRLDSGYFLEFLDGHRHKDSEDMCWSHLQLFGCLINLEPILLDGICNLILLVILLLLALVVRLFL